MPKESPASKPGACSVPVDDAHAAAAHLVVEAVAGDPAAGDYFVAHGGGLPFLHAGVVAPGAAPAGVK
jgi:hypothetical protein